MTAILNDNIYDYLERFAQEDDPLLDEMHDYAREHGMPVLDRQASRFLSVLVEVLRPMLAVEIGCNIGVSALNIARAMPEGKLITFDVSPQIVETARSFFQRAGVIDRIDPRVAEGLEGLREIPEGSVDFAFIDADKENYANYLDALYPLLKRGGVLCADNLLWSGRVTEDNPEEQSSRALKEFNLRLMSHPGFRAAILPVGDGIGFAVKTV